MPRMISSGAIVVFRYPMKKRSSIVTWVEDMRIFLRSLSFDRAWRIISRDHHSREKAKSGKKNSDLSRAALLRLQNDLRSGRHPDRIQVGDRRGGSDVAGYALGDEASNDRTGKDFSQRRCGRACPQTSAAWTRRCRARPVGAL